MSVFGPRFKLVSSSNVGYFDFHQGSDITPDVTSGGVTYHEDSPPPIVSMCAGEVDDVIDGRDSDVYRAIVRLLDDRPDAIGLTLPGMPADSPGMGGDESTWEQQPVMLIEHDGESSDELASYREGWEFFIPQLRDALEAAQ